MNYVSNITLRSGEKGNEMSTEIASINREFTENFVPGNVKILIGKSFIVLWKHDRQPDGLLLSDL